MTKINAGAGMQIQQISNSRCVAKILNNYHPSAGWQLKYKHEGKRSYLECINSLPLKSSN
jgi:hypothetical protein